jgi:Arc/MetJ-type ribon-helix-helix transcriptional regulator
MKKPISATIDEELIKWINEELEDKHKYRNKSHLIEIALDMLKKSGKND